MIISKVFKLDMDEWEKSEQYVEGKKMASIINYTEKSLIGLISKKALSEKYSKRMFYGKKSKTFINKNIIFSIWLIKYDEAEKYFEIPIESIEKLADEGAIEKYIFNSLDEKIIAYSKAFTNTFKKKYSLVGKTGIEPSGFFTIEEAYKEFGDEYSLNEFINYAFKNFDMKFKCDIWFIRKSSVYRKYYYLLKETRKKFNIGNQNIITEMIREGYIQEPLRDGGTKKGGGDVYFLKSDIDGKSYNDFKIFMAKKGAANIKLKLNEYNDKYEVIDSILSVVEDTPYQKTYKFLKEYIYNYANNSKKFRDKNYYSYISSIAITIIKNISREIMEYNDAEVRFLIMNSKLFSKYNSDQAAIMLEYIKDKSDHCKYSIVPRMYREKKEIPIEEKVYSPELIEKYFYYLADLEKHFEKAFNNIKYAELWCIALFHFSNAWRLVDIYQIPNINIECIRVSSFQDLMESGLNIGQATTLMNYIQESARDLISSKNGGNMPLIRDLDLMLQTAVAFILCELHRRKNGNDRMFQRYVNSNPNNVDWRWFFEDDELKAFGSMKANRSFMTGIFEYANGKEGFKRLAYAIIIKFRGHLIKENVDDTDTTRIYLEIIKQDGHVGDIAYECQRRGRFGFINYLILKSANFELDKVTREEVTNQLEIMKDNTTVSSMENFSDFLIYQNKIYSEIFQEVLELKLSSPDKFKSVVLKILRGDQPSKLSGCDCFVGIRNCPYKELENRYCAICKYNIPTMWILSKVKEDVYELIDKIENTYIRDKFLLEKYKTLLKKYSMVIVVAHNEFKKYDEEFINSFINIQEFEKSVKQAGARLKLLNEYMGEQYGK